MNPTDKPGAKPVASPAGTPPNNAADPYANWLDRMQRARARHAAITRNLYTWSNYKSWSEKMKSAWVEEGERPPLPQVPRR